LKLAEKYLLDPTVSMYLFDELNKWDYSSQKSRPDLEAEFRKCTNGWNMLLYGHTKRTVWSTVPQLDGTVVGFTTTYAIRAYHT